MDISSTRSTSRRNPRRPRRRRSPASGRSYGSGNPGSTRHAGGLADAHDARVLALRILAEHLDGRPVADDGGAHRLRAEREAEETRREHLPGLDLPPLEAACPARALPRGWRARRARAGRTRGAWRAGRRRPSMSSRKRRTAPSGVASGGAWLQPQAAQGRGEDAARRRDRRDQPATPATRSSSRRAAPLPSPIAARTSRIVSRGDAPRLRGAVAERLAQRARGALASSARRARSGTSSRSKLSIEDLLAVDAAALGRRALLVRELDLFGRRDGLVHREDVANLGAPGIAPAQALRIGERARGACSRTPRAPRRAPMRVALRFAHLALSVEAHDARGVRTGAAAARGRSSPKR